MKETYRPGSMGAAEERNAFYWKVGATIAIIIIALLFLFPFGGEYFHKYFVRAGVIWKSIGVVTIGAVLVYMWSLSKASDGAKAGLIIIGLLALAILCLAGWDFSLFGIES